MAVLLSGKPVAEHMCRDIRLRCEKLSRRGVIKLQLPDMAPESDFHLIARRAFKLEKPEGDVLDIVKTIRHNNGIGVYCHYLKIGARIAKNAGEEFS